MAIRHGIETRDVAGSGYTAELIGLRAAYIAGRSGLADLTATASSCVSLWEGGLSQADVDGTALLDRCTLSLIARSLALRGERVFVIGDDRLVPCADWDLSTRDGKPVAYRCSISEAGGGRTEIFLAAQVLHFLVGADATAPWLGQSPLRRARLTASLLHSIETALAEVFELAPLGSMIVPFPETSATDLETLGRDFRGRHGRVLMRESVAVSSAGGPVPASDWRPSAVSPDLSKSMSVEALDRARNSVLAAFGVLPSLFAVDAQGPLVRESERFLARWTLQPIAALVAEEATEKLGSEVLLDVLRPLQAYDSGARARSFATIIEGLAAAKAAGLDKTDVAEAESKVDW